MLLGFPIIMKHKLDIKLVFSHGVTEIGDTENHMQKICRTTVLVSGFHFDPFLEFSSMTMTTVYLVKNLSESMILLFPRCKIRSPLAQSFQSKAWFLQ
jgi:hypothetical protein